MTIWRTCIICWINKAIATHSEYVILSFHCRTVTRTRLNITLYGHCLSFFFLFLTFGFKFNLIAMSLRNSDGTKELWNLTCRELKVENFAYFKNAIFGVLIVVLLQGQFMWNMTSCFWSQTFWGNMSTFWTSVKSDKSTGHKNRIFSNATDRTADIGRCQSTSRVMDWQPNI